VRKADNLTTMCRWSRNLGASTSRNTEGLSRHVMGLLYLYLYNELVRYAETSVSIHQSVRRHVTNGIKSSWLYFPCTHFSVCTKLPPTPNKHLLLPTPVTCHARPHTLSDTHWPTSRPHTNLLIAQFLR